MHYPIIIISTTDYKLKSIPNITLNEATIIDNNSLNYDDCLYYFDYLIIDDLSLIDNLSIEKEHRRAITNRYLETSTENIFAIGKANNSTRDVHEEFNCVINYIMNNE